MKNLFKHVWLLSLILLNTSLVFSQTDSLVNSGAIATKAQPQTRPPEGVYHNRVGPVDPSYVCYEYAFVKCETDGLIEVRDGQTLYDKFINNGLFKPVNDGNTDATKVVYWGDLISFSTRDPKGITHAAMITKGNMVRSKEGSGALYENDIGYYYIDDRQNENGDWVNVNNGWTYKQEYALNTDLVIDNTEPKYGDKFTVSVKAGRLSGASYSWSSDPDVLEMEINNFNPSSVTCKVRDENKDFNGSVKIKLSVTHQKMKTGEYNTIYFKDYPKTVSNETIITIGTPLPQQPTKVSGYVTGDASINVGSTGSYRVVITQGTAPYTIEWFLRKGNDGQGSVLVATGSTLTLKSVQTASLMKKTSAITRQPIYYTDFYLSARITDANRTQCTTSELHIGAYGYVNLIPFGPEKALGNSSLEQDGMASFTVYPNPAIDQITVQSSMLLDEPATVTVYNALIIPVVTFQFDENAHTIDLKNIPAGLYIVKIEYKNYVETKKIVVN